MPARLPSVQVMLLAVVSVCEPVIRLAPPLSVRLRSLRLRPTTASLNTRLIEVTAVLRGSAATSVMSSVGAVVSAAVVAMRMAWLSPMSGFTPLFCEVSSGSAVEALAFLMPTVALPPLATALPVVVST